VRGRNPKSANLTFLARWPSRKAIQHACDRIREITVRARLWEPVEWIMEDLNRFLRGWAGYFRYGNSARVLGQIRNQFPSGGSRYGRQATALPTPDERSNGRRRQGARAGRRRLLSAGLSRPFGSPPG
jgi:Group II intron, maturase-specific domain